jgi:hypothetical protein
MQIHNVLYRGWTIVMLVTLLLPTGSLPGTATLTGPAGWQEVGSGSASGGGISDNSGNSFWPSLAVAPDGTPYVAWSDDSGGVDKEIYVRCWKGSNWEEVGSGSASGGGISNNWGDSFWPSLAVASDGTPYVAWHDFTGGDREIYVRRWNGSSWEEVGTGSASGGGISDNDGASWVPSLAVAPDGTPYVAWYDDSSGDEEIYVRRWNGSSWEEVGSGSASGGGISDNDGWSYRPSVAVAPDGTPYVAWYDDSSGDEEIYVRRWNGSSWEEVGSGSASGGGISDNSGNSSRASVAVAPDGTPYVAWQDDSGGDYEIYVRRWNGSSWEEVGSGSASGGGISDNSGDSYSPSVAVAPGGRPYVAWYDDSSGDEEIYVRRWVPPVYLPIVMTGYCACGPDNYEPNDSCAQAHGPLTSGQTYPSWISCCDQATYKKSDYFYIDISTKEPINIDLTDIPASTNYDLYLYSDPGQDPDSPVKMSEGTGSSETISYEDPPAPGRYYIRVYGRTGYSTSPYSLTVTYD